MRKEWQSEGGRRKWRRGEEERREGIRKEGKIAQKRRERKEDKRSGGREGERKEKRGRFE